VGELAWILVPAVILLVVVYFAGRLVNVFGTSAYSEASKVSMINRYLVWRDRGPDDPRDPD
jgi:NhaP-type Na+/H+ or K+/H+ antiporter